MQILLCNFLSLLIEWLYCQAVVGFFYGLNFRDIQLFNLALQNILKYGLICDYPIFYKFIQVHENKEDKNVILSTKAWSVLSLLHNIDTKNDKLQKNEKSSTWYYHILDIKVVQHKNVNMSGYYRYFSHRPASSEKYIIRGRNTITLHYNFRVDLNLVSCVFFIRLIPCAWPYCVAQLDKYWLPRQSYLCANHIAPLADSLRKHTISGWWGMYQPTVKVNGRGSGAHTAGKIWRPVPWRQTVRPII